MGLSRFGFRLLSLERLWYRPYCQFLEARIIPERIEHRIEPEQRRSERHALKPVRLRTVSKAVSVKRRWRGRVLPSALPPGRGSRSERDRLRASFSIGITAMARSDKSECGGFVTKTHIDQREISNEDIIFRLFFEERFQFAARLSPTFLGGGMVAGDFLCPA